MFTKDAVTTVLAIGGATAVVVSLIKPILPTFKLRTWLLRVIAVALGGVMGWLMEGLWDGVLMGILAGSLSTLIYKQIREFFTKAAEKPVFPKDPS